jgi:hypothetical protein
MWVGSLVVEICLNPTFSEMASSEPIGTRQEIKIFRLQTENFPIDEISYCWRKYVAA